MTLQLHHGDCLEVLRTLGDGSAVDEQEAIMIPLPSCGVNGRYPSLSTDGLDFDENGLLWWYEPRLGWKRDDRNAIDCIPYPTHWAPGRLSREQLPALGQPVHPPPAAGHQLSLLPLA